MNEPLILIFSPVALDFNHFSAITVYFNMEKCLDLPVWIADRFFKKLDQGWEWWNFFQTSTKNKYNFSCLSIRKAISKYNSFTCLIASSALCCNTDPEKNVLVSWDKNCIPCNPGPALPPSRAVEAYLSKYVSRRVFLKIAVPGGEPGIYCFLFIFSLSSSALDLGYCAPISLERSLK